MKKDDNNNKKSFSKKKKSNTHFKEDQQHEEQPRNVHRGQHNGIADYFAILGIGDNLQMMKATQPKSHGQHEENNPNDDSCQQEKEEQCQMMQRFYREIVHVGILSVYSGKIMSPGAPSWSRGFPAVGEKNNHHDDNGSRLGSTRTVVRTRRSSMDDDGDSLGCDGRSSTIYAAHLASSANIEFSHDDFDAKDDDSNCDYYYGSGSGSGSGSAQECQHDHDQRNECISDHGGGDDQQNRVVQGGSRRSRKVTPLIPLLHPRPGIGIADGGHETKNGGDSVVVIKRDYDYLPEQVDGFQIIYKTLPASAPFHQQGRQQQQQESFFQGGQDVSLNMSSLSMNTTFDGSSSKDAHDCEENTALGGELWTKGQTFLANMHPCEGYRSKLLSNISLSSSSAAGALADDSLLLDTTNPTMNSSGTSHVVSTRQLLDAKYKKDGVEQKRGNDKDGSKLFSKITRPTMSKLRQHIFSPLLHHQNSTSFAKDENHVDLLVENKSHLNNYKCVSTPRVDSPSKHSTSEKACVPIQKKEFYIGYRRREPDETDVPGIADCKIVYCRIHKDSILPEKMDLGKRLRITCNGLHHGGSGEGDDSIKLGIADKACGSTERVVTNNVQTKNNSAPKQKTTVAVMKNSLMATAEIAKNVVSHGRDRLRMATVTGLNDPVLPTFDTHVEKAEDEMNGNVEHHFGIPRGVSKECDSRFYSGAAYDVVNLDELLDIPEGYDEWVIPEMYQQIRLPVPPSPSTSSPRNRIATSSVLDESFGSPSESNRNRMQRTFLVNSNESPSADNAGVGVEVYVDGNTFLNHSPKCYKECLGMPQRNPWSPVKGQANKFHDVLSLHSLEDENKTSQSIAFDRGEMLPCVIDDSSLPSPSAPSESNCIYHEYVPLLALRRQRIRNEERYREDPSIIDLGMTFTGLYGDPVLPVQEEEDFEDDENEGSQILGISPWTGQDVFYYASSKNSRLKDDTEQEESVLFGTPRIITRRNVPLGFLDTPFATSVLDRFPKKDYKGLPLPEEELPMFCYPTGCKLIRLKYQDSPLPEHYGFVVKNERGDSVYGKR